MKRIFSRTAIFSITFFYLLGIGVVSAEGTLEKIKQQGFIRVGFANEVPLSYANSSGQLKGEFPYRDC